MGNVRLYGSTSGYTELAPPAVAPDGVLSLPSGTGTLLTAEGGKVLQIVSNSTATAITSSSSIWADTGLTATITPSSASSKILVVVHTNGVRKDNNTAVGLQLLRGASVIALIAITAAQDGASGFQEVGTASISFEDTPATTSATTYKTQFRSHNNIATASLQRNDCVSTITLMEVSA